DGHLRIGLAELPDHRQRQHRARRWRKPERHLTARLLRGRSDVVAERPQLPLKPAEAFQDALARFGRRYAAPVAHQKVGAKLLLEGVDVAAQRRLGDPQGLRRPADVAMLDDGDKVLDRADVESHGEPFVEGQKPFTFRISFIASMQLLYGLPPASML